MNSQITASATEVFVVRVSGGKCFVHVTPSSVGWTYSVSAKPTIRQSYAVAEYVFKIARQRGII